MNKILMVVVAIMLAVSLCFAAGDKPKPEATTPAGAVVEAGGVIIGKLTSVVEKSFQGKKKGSLVLAEEDGKTKIVPLGHTVKALDAGFNAVTLKQLQGKKVSVEVSKKGKATKVQEVK